MTSKSKGLCTERKRGGPEVVTGNWKWSGRTIKRNGESGLGEFTTMVESSLDSGGVETEGRTRETSKGGEVSPTSIILGSSWTFPLTESIVSIRGP